MVGIAVFASILVFLYLNGKPLDRPESNIEFPYVLSAKPALIGSGESTSSTVSIFNGTGPNSSKDSLYVVAPDGLKMTPKEGITDLARLRFPQDFRPAPNLQLGDYTVVFVPNNITAAAVQLKFEAVGVPVLAELYNFVFGDGLLPTFGLAGSIVTFAYQIASSRKSDSEHIATEKAKWITENMRNYVQVTDQDADIYRKLKNKVKTKSQFNKSDADDILYGMILYYQAHWEFLKKPGLYYFDDYTLETFLTALGVRILETFQQIIGDRSDELSVLGTKRFSQLLQDQKFIGYRGKLLLWLNTNENAKTLYLNHLTHYHTLLVGINKALLDTYSNTRKLRKDLERGISEYREDLNSAIKNLCRTEFEDESYFSLFNAKNKLNL